jgi:tRNA(Ile)-lysidine synthase
MHPLEKRTLQTVRQENLLLAGEKVVIGVSGGPDSMALLHVLVRLAPVLDITLAAAYVNHGLRPGEAKKEQCLVADETGHLGIDFFTGAVDVKGLAAERKLSIEHAARLRRYDFLAKTAHRFGATKIALAHTADDQAEEILLRLVRGTARKGLSGMKTLRAAGFIRPFLRFPKSHLLQYLADHSIPHLLDSSNMQNVYLRNRIRNDLLPYLAARYNPGIRQTLIRTAVILQDEEELLESMAETAFAKTVVIHQQTVPSYGRSAPEADSFNQVLKLCLDLFAQQPRAIQRRILEKCCWLMACTPRSRQIEQLLQHGGPGSSAATLHLADGLRVTKNKGHLIFSYPSGSGPFRGNLADGNTNILLETAIPSPGIYEFPALNKRLVVEETADFHFDAESTGEYLDGDLFSFPLTLRGPEAGDRFHPLGAPGSKKVFDFLSDKKIVRSEKKLIPVLCDDDAILALPGLRIDNRFRITDKTSRVIHLSWEEREGETEG